MRGKKEESKENEIERKEAKMVHAERGERRRRK